MTSQVCRLICIFLNLLSIYNLWVNLSQTWTDYVFGVFFPSLALYLSKGYGLAADI